jgi:hypothetical protein
MLLQLLVAQLGVIMLLPGRLPGLRICLELFWVVGPCRGVLVVLLASKDAYLEAWGLLLELPDNAADRALGSFLLLLFFSSTDVGDSSEVTSLVKVLRMWGGFLVLLPLLLLLCIGGRVAKDFEADGGWNRMAAWYGFASSMQQLQQAVKR